MQDLIISATISTPAVHFQADAGRLRIEGESYPENSMAFYQPVLDWVAERLDQDVQSVHLEICLTYLNTSSIKCMMDLMDMLEEEHGQGRAATITWYYDEENDRALEMAEEFKEELTLPFHIVPLAGKMGGA